MATEILVKVYKDGSGDYTSFKAAWDANKQDLVANDSYIQFEFSGDLRNTDSFADATGYTTDVTRNLRIRAKAGEEATSIAGAGTIYGTNTYIMVCRGKDITIDGIEIDGWSNTLHTSSKAILKNSIIHGGSTAVSSTAGFSTDNVILYDCVVNSLSNANSNKTTQVNKTGLVSVMYREAAGVITYCAAHNTHTGNNNYFATTNPLNDFNASDDTSAPGASTYAVGTSDFKDYVGGDYDIDPSSPLFALGIGAALTPSGGGGVTVTGATPSFNYSSIAASIDLTGSIDITGQTANYTYSSASGTIDLTGDILITGATASYNYQSINGVVDLTGEITVLGVTPSQSYSSVSGIIELGAVISIVGVTPNYNYQGITGEVSLNGEILVSGETPSYSYSAIKGFITTGEAQVIGTVTSSFAGDAYASGFKPSTITVNFKS